MKRGLAFCIMVAAILIISAFLYSQLSSDTTLKKSNNGKLLSSSKTLEKSSNGKLPSIYENSEAKFGLFIENNEFSSTMNKISFYIKNYGTTYIDFGTFYSIETFRGDGWYKIPFKEKIVFTANATLLGPGGTYKSTITLDDFSYKFTEGKYRIIKEFLINKSVVPLAAEFYYTDR